MSVPGSKLPCSSPSLPRPLSPERTPSDGAVRDDQLRRRGLGQQIGAGLLGLGLHVAAEGGDRDHLVAVVLLRRRRWDAELALAVGEEVDRLLLDLAEGEALLAPLLAGQVGEELLQWARAHDRAGEVVAAAGFRLLDHRDRDLAQLLHRLRVVGQQLQQAVGAGEPGGAAADDRDADLDPLVLAVEAALDELLVDVDRGREVRRGDLGAAGSHVTAFRVD